MKKLKGFTLVELIVVMAIFSIIMAAVLSILQPVSNVYSNTANYEHARASSDNVRTYVEDSLRYADRMKVVANAANISEAESEAAAIITGLQNVDGSDRIATPDNPIYIMEINNDVNSENQMGYITIYKYDNGSAMSSKSIFKSINTNLYDNYGYSFVICTDDAVDHSVYNMWDIDKSTHITEADAETEAYKNDSIVKCPGYFTTFNSQMQLEIYKYNYKTSSYEDTTYSSAITFSMLNLRDKTEQFEIHYDSEGNQFFPGQNGYDTASIICPVTKQCYQGVVDKASGNNIYFIYTLPKYANEY